MNLINYRDRLNVAKNRIDMTGADKAKRLTNKSVHCKIRLGIENSSTLIKV